MHEIFKALSEPTRLRMMVLLTEGERCVCDLTEVMQLPQSTVSRHMSRLKLTGLVSDHRSGRWIHYRLALGSSGAESKVIGLLNELRIVEPHRTDLMRLAEIDKTKTCA